MHDHPAVRIRAQRGAVDEPLLHDAAGVGQGGYVEVGVVLDKEAFAEAGAGDAEAAAGAVVITQKQVVHVVDVEDVLAGHR